MEWLSKQEDKPKEDVPSELDWLEGKKEKIFERKERQKEHEEIQKTYEQLRLKELEKLAAIQKEQLQKEE